MYCRGSAVVVSGQIKSNQIKLFRVAGGRQTTGTPLIGGQRDVPQVLTI